MSEIEVKPFEHEHYSWAEAFVRDTWGSLRQVSRGKLYQVLDYPGFVAMVDKEPQGILTYRFENHECEVLLLQSAVDSIGIGSTLIAQVESEARSNNCKRLWLITTNDNIRAIRWYQRRGFTIAAVHVNALEESRRLKPEIPMIGNDNIPLRDEIEFEKCFGNI